MRPATGDDAPFLVDMLVEAVNWPPRKHLSRDEILSTRQLARYVECWPRPSDQGVIAVVGEETIGAVWLRFFAPEEPGFAYLAEDIPELAMAVLPGWRGRGVGRALLREQIRRATVGGVRSICLSVERANGAVRLYESEGFQIVEQEGPDDHTMLRHL